MRMMTILLAILCLVLTTLLILAARRLTSCSDMLKDATGPVSASLKILRNCISTFASGDLRVRAVMPAERSRSAAGRVLDELVRTGLTDFNTITDIPSRRVCFSGANSYHEGKIAGMRIAEILGGKGSVACIIPFYNQINHVLRMKGCLNYLEDQYPQIKTLGIFEGAGNREVSIQRTEEILAANKNLDILYVTDGHTPPSVVETIEKLGRKEVKVVAFDAMPENIALLKAGKILCLIEQNSFAQAFNALVHLYNAREAGWRPLTPKLFMQPISIDLRNYRTYWDDETNSRIMMDEERSDLAIPEPNKSGSRYRFALIMPLSTGFFEGLGRGAAAAKKTLAEYGVEVEVIDAFHEWADFGSASIFNPIIERFVREGYDGFATVVVDPPIVYSINDAVAAGLTVTTFNTEPSSFREIVLNMINNVENLADNSQSLAAAAEQSARATAQIGSSIDGIKEYIHEQKNRIAASDTELKGLNQMIGEVQKSLTGYGDLVEKLTSESMEGSRRVDGVFEETKGLKEMIGRIEAELTTFSQRLSQVREFAAVIEQLAENTNVLAINASIQAARAGTAGKAFAVVAGEVRTLAENSRHTAEDIRDMVGEITSNMAKILKESESGSNHVAQTLERAQEAKQSFESISSVIRSANAEISRIEGAMGGIVNMGSSVKGNMDEIDRMSNQSVDRLDEISRSVDELALQGSHLSETANTLRTMATNQGIVFSQLSVKESDE